MSTTETITLMGNGTYLLTVALSGDHMDERQTYLVHTPLNGNLNVDFKPMHSSSYVWPPQASITVATQDGGGGWQANSNSNHTLKVTYKAGGASANWSYTAVRF